MTDNTSAAQVWRPQKFDFRLIAPQQIIIERDERQRATISVEDLIGSIRARGIISPLIVDDQRDGTYRLIAGERRLTCALQLGFSEVPVRLLDDLDVVERQIIELEENIKRQDLEWQDIAKSIQRIHQLYNAKDGEWTLAQTANAINLSPGSVTLYMTVASKLNDPSVRGAGTAREAYNLLGRRLQREQSAALEELLDDEPIAPPAPRAPTMVETLTEPELELPTAPPPTASPAPLIASGILCADFKQWAATYTGPKFNLFHIDFPYGIGVFTQNTIRTGESRSQMGRDLAGGEGYTDTPDSYRDLALTFVESLKNLSSFSAHVIWWFSGKWEDEQWTRELFTQFAPDIRWSRFKLIWHKTDNAGIASSTQYEPRHVYEQALFGIRGNRQIVRIKADTYGSPTDKSIHMSAKPEPMLRHFFEMLVDEHTVMLDPTCGSGTSVRAAETLGAKLSLGLEIDPQMAKMAAARLEEDRRKRRAAEMLGI